MAYINYQPVYVVLGGPEPGIMNTLPFITAGRNSPSFPIAVQVCNQLQAREVNELQAIVRTYTTMRPPVANVHTLARYFWADPGVNDTLVDTFETFWAVYFGKRIGIFVDWRVASQFYDGARVQGCRKFRTFRGAFCFLISKGYLNDGDTPPVRDQQPPPPPPPRPRPRNIRLDRDDSGTITVHESGSEEEEDDYTEGWNRSAWHDDTTTTLSYTTGENPPPYSAQGSVPSTPSKSSKARDLLYTSTSATSGSSGHGRLSIGSTGTSSTSSSPQSFKSRSVRVYRYLRSLSGITGVINHRRDMPGSRADEAVAAVSGNEFGPVVRSYLVSHGYDAEAVAFITSAYNGTTSLRDFVHVLSKQGMSRSELEWIWVWAEKH